MNKEQYISRDLEASVDALLKLNSGFSPYMTDRAARVRDAMKRVGDPEARKWVRQRLQERIDTLKGKSPGLVEKYERGDGTTTKAEDAAYTMIKELERIIRNTTDERLEKEKADDREVDAINSLLSAYYDGRESDLSDMIKSAGDAVLRDAIEMVSHTGKSAAEIESFKQRLRDELESRKAEAKFEAIKADRMTGLIEWCKDKAPEKSEEEIKAWAEKIFNRKYGE